MLYFNNDSKVVVLDYTRLVMIFFAYIFSMLYENMSGQDFPDHSGIFEPSNIPGDFNGISGQSVGNGTADSDDTCSLQAFTESGNKGL